MKLRICFEIGGLGEDEHGNPVPVGLAVTLRETNGNVDYQEFVQKISIDSFLKLVCLDNIVKPEDVRIITPEEFDEKYGAPGEEDQ